MNEKALFICSTPYQIMVTMLLKHQIDYQIVDIAITDTFSGYERILSRIRDSGFFNRAFELKTKELLVTKSVKDKLKKIAFFLDFKKRIKKELPYAGEYAAIYYNCEDFYLFNLITYAKIENNTKIFRYEEGYSTYTKNQSSSNISRQITILRNRILYPKVNIKIDGIYLFEPDLMTHEFDCSVITIDRSFVDNSAFKREVNCIFNSEAVGKTYKNRIIIFEESFTRDGIKVDDYELYSRLIRNLGNEKISIKLHPRSTSNRFEKMDVDVHKADGVPWEAILLSGEFENSILISLASGSVINSRLLMGGKVTSLLLFKCLTHRPPILDAEFELFVHKFASKYKQGLFIPGDLKETIEIINKCLETNKTDLLDY